MKFLTKLMAITTMIIGISSCQNATNQHKVIFDFNDETTTPYIETVRDGDLVNEISEPARSGFDFGGWYKDNQLYDFSLPVHTDFTLQAQWNALATNWNTETLQVFNTYLSSETPPYIEFNALYDTEVDLQSGGAVVTIFSTQPVSFGISEYISIFEQENWNYYSPLSSFYGFDTVSFYKSSSVPGFVLLVEIQFGDIYMDQAPNTNFIRINSMLIDLDFPAADISEILSMFTGNPELTPIPELTSNDYSLAIPIPNFAEGYLRIMIFDFKQGSFSRYQDDLLSLGYVRMSEAAPLLQYRLPSEGFWGDLVLQIAINGNITELGFFPSSTVFWPKAVLAAYFEDVTIPEPFAGQDRRFYFYDFIEIAGKLDLFLTNATQLDLIIIADAFKNSDWDESSSSSSELIILEDPTKNAQVSISFDLSTNEVKMEFLQLFFTGLTWMDVLSLASTETGYDLGSLPEADDSSIFAYGFIDSASSASSTNKIDLYGATPEFATIYKESLTAASFDYRGKDQSGNWDTYVSPDGSYRLNVQILWNRVALEFLAVNSWLSEFALLKAEFPFVDFSTLPTPTKTFRDYMYRPLTEFAPPAIRLIGATEQDVIDYITALVDAGFTADNTIESGFTWYIAPSETYAVRAHLGGVVNRQIYLQFIFPRA